MLGSGRCYGHTILMLTMMSGDKYNYYLHLASERTGMKRVSGNTEGPSIRNRLELPVVYSTLDTVNFSTVLILPWSYH